MDARNCIRFNLNVESIIQTRLNEETIDFNTMDTMLKHILKYDHSYTEDKYAHFMQLMPFIVMNDIQYEELPVFFNFFLDTSEEDADHYCLNIRKEIPQEVLVTEQLKPNLSSYARECLKVRTYEKNFKLKVEDPDHYAACQAHLDFEMPSALT